MGTAWERHAMCESALCYIHCTFALKIRIENHIFSVPYYIVTCGLSGPTAITYFPMLSYKRHDFRTKNIESIRQARRVSLNIEATSCDPCCRGKAISITHSECVFVALVIQHAMRMRRVWLARPHNIFFHFISQKARISKKKSY